jgi:RND family efflux transporter MFP subunit
MSHWRSVSRPAGCLAGAAALLLTCLSGTACGRRGAGAPEGGSSVTPARVKLQRVVELARVEQRSIVYHVETVGILEAEGQTDIAAGVSGIVDEVLFREGDEVTPGTLLVKIDQVRYEAEAAAAQAAVDSAKAAYELASDLYHRAERAGRGASEEEKVKARGSMLVSDALLRSAQAMLTRAQLNLDRSRVRAPYAGKINKRMVTKGTYLEEKTPIATIADLSRIRLVAYVPETAAPALRELFRQQEERIAAIKATLPLGGWGSGQVPWPGLAGLHLIERDYVLSGFDPEFELLAQRGHTFHARLFSMSTVANPETHMFEVKAEVLGWSPGSMLLGLRNLQKLPEPRRSATRTALQLGGLLADRTGLTSPVCVELGKSMMQRPPVVELHPGYTAKIRFPLRTSPNAAVIPEEAGKWVVVRASEHGFIAFVPEMERDENGKVVRDKDGRPQWIARRRTLELGYRAPGWIEVRAGLAPGEWIVRRGADALEDGSPLQISEEQLRQLEGR